jgi:outer membrane biosynthesis protein TonB
MIFYQIQNLIKEGKIDEAIELAEKEYSKSKDDKLYNLYGIALFKKKEFEKASEVFGELYRKHPENLNLLLNYSRALIESGNLEEAERVLREGSMVFPESEKLSELLSECQRRKEEMKEKEGEKEKIEEEGKILEVEEVKLEKVGEKEEVEKAEEIEKVEEKIEELKREIEEEIETKTLEKEEEKIEEKEKEEEEKIEERIPEREEEKIELRKTEEKEGLLKRGRILEISLKGESEIILRETFIIFISGSYKLFPLKKIEDQKIRDDFFGGKNHKFIKIRGIDCEVTLSAEYISAFEVDETYGKAVILEPFLIGFEPSFKYNLTKIKKTFNLVELSGQGKVIIYTAKSKAFIKNIDGETRISAPNFVGAMGPLKLNFLHDSFEISGSGKIILRV